MGWFEVLCSIPDVMTVRPVSPERVWLQTAGERWTVDVHRVQRPPRPHELDDLRTPDPGPGLFVAPRLTSGARRALERAGWWWADETDAAIHTDRGWRRAAIGKPASDQGWLARRRTAEAGPPSGRMSGSPAGSDLAVVRLLVTCPDRWTQTALAERIGVSQPAISKALARLRARGLVGDGIDLTDLATAVDWWLAGYPGPTGLVSHWYGLDDPWTTTIRLVEAAAEGSVVSGPIGADVLAPWVAPDRVVVYARSGIDPLPPELVMVDRVADAVATIVVTDDRDIFWQHPAAQAVTPAGGRVRVADPLQVLWDLARLPSDDPGRRDEAADHLRGWILDPARES